MGTHNYIQSLWDPTRNRPDIVLVRALLALLSPVYLLVTTLRLWLYRSAVCRTHRLPARVISIGNITVGGTGKTPLVMFLAVLLAARGKKVAIISRGYRRTGHGTLVVSDGKSVLATSAEAGDEPFLMATRLTGIPVIVNADRKAAGACACERFGAEYIIMDDGFQHVCLARDCDIVMLDAAQPLGNHHVLPWGPLREGAAGLARASVFVFSRANQSAAMAQLPPHVQKVVQQRPVFTLNYQAGTVKTIDNLCTYLPTDLSGKKAMVFAGIANPRSLRQTITTLGVSICAEHYFPDHHPYTPDDLSALDRLAVQHGVDLLLTTEKDAVRLPQKLSLCVPVCQVGLEVKLGQDVDTLLSLVLKTKTIFTQSTGSVNRG
jgi:tetraacyldisaccharide 4'-kinase